MDSDNCQMAGFKRWSVDNGEVGAWRGRAHTRQPSSPRAQAQASVASWAGQDRKKQSHNPNRNPEGAAVLKAPRKPCLAKRSNYTESAARPQERRGCQKERPGPEPPPSFYHTQVARAGRAGPQASTELWEMVWWS